MNGERCSHETFVSSLLQEEHAEEQTDGHREKEIQHGPQEGERAAPRRQSCCCCDGRRSEWQVWISPPQGIGFLMDSSLLKSTNEEIAKFLYKGEGLNKTAIGEYLGER